MTRVELHYVLDRPLDEAMMTRIAAAHGIYGLYQIAPTPDLASLLVEFDASRLTPEQVTHALRRAGIPARLQ